MARRQRHPVLRKIASRRWRTALSGSRSSWSESPAARPRVTDHFGHRSPLGGERILTPRETEVLLHVARGETDQEIADKLFLSRRTVNTHVSNILGKLSVTNRRDAVAAAFRIGLL